MPAEARAPRYLLAALVTSGALALVPACGADCCASDRRPIPLARAAGGELITTAAVDDRAPGVAVLDTASAVTVWRTPDATTPPTVRTRRLTLYDGTAPAAPPARRAVLREVSVIETALADVGTAMEPLTPQALIGADTLMGISTEIDFAAPSLLLWLKQPLPDGFLSSVGYAVLHVPRRGGGAIEVRDPDNLFDDREARTFSPTRLVLRACAAPSSFRREDPLPERCCQNEERRNATGADVSLLVATGTGPLVLARSAWERVRAHDARLEDPAPGRELRLAWSRAPVRASWARLPRLALVDREVPLRHDPGPCAELARARRLEQVAAQQVATPDRVACPLPCDRDPDETSLGQSSAAYVELGDDLEVAVIDDAEPFLQAIRAEVRPEGPEVDGLLGASTLARTRLEIDAVEKTTRLIFACAVGAPPSACRSVGQCPRLPGPGQKRVCFGLPAHQMPAVCDNLASSCGP